MRDPYEVYLIDDLSRQARITVHTEQLMSLTLLILPPVTSESAWSSILVTSRFSSAVLPSVPHARRGWRASLLDAREDVSEKAPGSSRSGVKRYREGKRGWEARDKS